MKLIKNFISHIVKLIVHLLGTFCVEQEIFMFD